MLAHRVVSDAFYYVIGLDPETAPANHQGLRGIYEVDSVMLDPGGVLHTKIEWVPFVVDGLEFKVQLHNAELIATTITNRFEMVNGHAEFLIWRYKFMMPYDMMLGIVEELVVLGSSEAAAHTELDAHNSLLALEENTKFISGRGRTPMEILERLKELGYNDDGYVDGF